MLNYQYDAEAEARVIRQEGRHEGEKIKARDIAKNLLAVDSMSREEISGATGLTLDELNNLTTVH